MSLPFLRRRGRKAPPFSPSFTLIELMVVMGIIAILASLTLGTMGYAQKKAGRSRAAAEIAAFEAGLERYKSDNGTYPEATGIQPNGTNYDLVPTDSTYLTNAVILYQALSGKTNFSSYTSNPVYIEFKLNQVNTNTEGANFVKDPFGNAYGYQCDPPGTTNNYAVLFNVGFFDVWSTAGQSGTGKQTNLGLWVSNWASQ